MFRWPASASSSWIVRLVSAYLDYCNSLLYGTFDHLQHVQNLFARAVIKADNLAAAAALAADPSVCQLRTITFKTIHAGTSTYLACELHHHQPLSSLCSSTTTTLHRHHALSNFHQHAFVVAAPATCNIIPASIRHSGSLDTLQTALKTHLINSAYMPCH